MDTWGAAYEYMCAPGGPGDNTTHGTNLCDVAIIELAFDVPQLTGLDSSMSALIGTLLTQYGLKRGLREFGQQVGEGVSAEMQQLHDLQVMRLKSSTSLSPRDRRDALNCLMFLKRKRDRRVRGRGFADGRKQQQNAIKGEASSPTVSTEAVFLLLTIASREGRDVMTMDIPGTFLQIDRKGERVHGRLEGRMAELLAMIKPNFIGRTSA